MLTRAGDGSSLFGGLDRSPFSVFLGDSGVGLYMRDFICPSGPNGHRVWEVNISEPQLAVDGIRTSGLCPVW